MTTGLNTVAQAREKSAYKTMLVESRTEPRTILKRVGRKNGNVRELYLSRVVRESRREHQADLSRDRQVPGRIPTNIAHAAPEICSCSPKRVVIRGRQFRTISPASLSMIESLQLSLHAEYWNAVMEIAFNVIVERDEDGYYVATVPELRGCHTQARSLDTLMERIREAIDLCLEEQGPPVSAPEFVGVQRVTVEL